MSVPIDLTFKEQATDPWVMLCDTILSLRDKSEKQEGSTLARPTDHSGSARPLFMGVWGILKNRALGVFSVKMRWAQ
ncbi:hypothetical protein [Allomuricauda sp. CP2A]|uniref:hypothetical protein n=1 Tax=Allomuricauda sp. CP2A TaxID=1848189 RepID=UPI0011473B92|nr:hypothetical protein [Muricauda sp. CP2A]